MKMITNTKISLLVVVLGVIIAGVSLVSCKNDNVPYDTKYIADFHRLSNNPQIRNL